MANTTTPDISPAVTPTPETPQAAVRPQEAPTAPRSANVPHSTPEAATGPVQPREDAQMDHTEAADPWKPTRRIPVHRRETGGLTPAQLALADDLHTRALALRAASDEGLSIREAVDLAAVQLGLEAPTEGETR